jgi:hypothetical protein
MSGDMGYVIGATQERPRDSEIENTKLREKKGWIKGSLEGAVR